MTRVEELRDLWTGEQVVVVRAHLADSPAIGAGVGDQVTVFMPREPIPGQHTLAGDVLDLLVIADAAGQLAAAQCTRVFGVCLWNDHGPHCPVKIATNRVLDAHAAFETRVTEEETS